MLGARLSARGGRGKGTERDGKRTKAAAEGLGKLFWSPDAFPQCPYNVSEQCGSARAPSAGVVTGTLRASHGQTPGSRSPLSLPLSSVQRGIDSRPPNLKRLLPVCAPAFFRNGRIVTFAAASRSCQTGRNAYARSSTYRLLCCFAAMGHNVHV